MDLDDEMEGCHTDSERKVNRNRKREEIRRVEGERLRWMKNLYCWEKLIFIVMHCASQDVI